MRALIQQGFTLAELLVILAVIGFVSMLLLPKMTVAVEKKKRTAVVKDLTMAITQAYGVLSVKEGVSAATSFPDIARYLSNARLKTSGEIDTYPGGAAIDCGSGSTCYSTASGAVIAVDSTHTFAEQIPTASLRFVIDTDGDKQAGTTLTNGGTIADTAGAGAGFYLTYDGRLNSVSNPVPGNRMNGSTAAACSNCTPRWLDWMN